MDHDGRATRIRLRDVRSAPMRAFHMAWLAFFLAFFGWFGVAPLMPIIREELGLTKSQIGNTIIASVAITIVARIAIGWLCDRYGPRRTYSALLVLGSIPVMTIGLAQTYETFLLFRLAIGTIGAAFVITQVHTSLMFAPNCVGTANATAAGWGNLGGGVTQLVMPLLFAALLGAGLSPYWSWRLAMVVPGILLLAVGVAYYFLTTDMPRGDLDGLRARGGPPRRRVRAPGGARALRDHRVWALFVVYGACFGVELTINNIAALYFHDRFALDVRTAGLIAALFGMMNLFARTLGGLCGDRAGQRWGLRGRVQLLGALLLAEGLALMLLSQMDTLAPAIAVLIVFSLFVQMAEGATFAVVPFVANAVGPRTLGMVSGIVGAGGNAGAVAAGFLLRAEGLAVEEALLILGLLVAFTAALTRAIRFSRLDEHQARHAVATALAAPAAPARQSR